MINIAVANIKVIASNTDMASPPFGGYQLTAYRIGNTSRAHRHFIGRDRVCQEMQEERPRLTHEDTTYTNYDARGGWQSARSVTKHMIERDDCHRSLRYSINLYVES